MKKNLINTINKELNNYNSLYLNHCSAEIQILRAFNNWNDITPILNLKPLNSLKSILNELLATKQEQADKMSNDFELLIEQEQQRTEINPNFEKANSQIIEKYESKNENEINNPQKKIENFYNWMEKHTNIF